MVKLLDWVITGATKNGIGREAIALQAAQATVVKADEELDTVTASARTDEDAKSGLAENKAAGKAAASKEVSSEVTGTADGDLAVIKDVSPQIVAQQTVRKIEAPEIDETTSIAVATPSKTIAAPTRSTEVEAAPVRTD